MESTFWGIVVKPGKAQPFVPPPVDAKLHLSQATLSMDAENGTKVGVTCTLGEDVDEEVLLCTLREGATESQSLDLVFDHYTEFNVKGNAAVHLTGYYMPDFEEDETSTDEEEDEEDEEDLLMDLSPEEAAALAQYQNSSRYTSKIMFADADDEDDDEDEDESEDDDDEDDDEDMMGDDENNITIVELNDDGTEKADSDEDDEDEDDEEEEEEEDEEEEMVTIEGAPRMIEVAGPDRDEKAGRETTKRKAANGAMQDGAAAKKNKVDEKAAAVTADAEEAAAREQKEKEPQAATGKKAKKGKNGTGASVLDTWRAAPMQEKKGKNGNGTEARTQPSDNATERGIPIKNGRPNIRKFDNGFVMEDTSMGPPDGKVAKLGQKVAVRYRGTLAKNGKVFDETKGNKTFTFRLGVGEVIKGWDRGLVGMRVGDKRRLTVPPQMAYGTSGVRGAIPPNATLNFDVELCDVKGK